MAKRQTSEVALLSGDPVRIAFIGCGGMSRLHLGSWGALHARGAAFRVVAAADAIEALAAGHAQTAEAWQGHPVSVYTDWRRMIETERPEAVDVCTPHHLHHEVAAACLEAGVDVIVEKPLGVTLRAARRMVETARRTGRILAVGEQVRRWPGPRALGWAARGEGLLGAPRLVSIQHVGGSRQDPTLTRLPGAMAWRLDRRQAGGGVVLDVGVHMADMLLHCFGPIRRATATTSCFGNLPHADGRRADVEDAASILLEFEQGFGCTWTHASVLAGEAVHNNAYHGTGGSVVAPGFYPQAPRFTRWDREQVLEPEAFLGAYLDSLAPEERERLFPAWVAEDPRHAPGPDLGVRLELAEFLDSVRTRRAPEVGAAEGLSAQAIAATILESAHLGGQPLLVDDVLSGRVSGYQDPIDQALGLL